MISQKILLILGGIFLLYEMFQGWRRGVARCFVSLLALLMASAIGYYFGILVAPFLRGIFPYPDFLIAVVAGLIVGAGIYFFLWLFASILLKTTKHQKSTLIWFLYGTGGAILGCVYGLLILWGAISMVRAFGAYAESRTELHRTEKTPSVSIRVEDRLIDLKKALEFGSTGKTVEKVDIVPTGMYTFIVKFGQISANPEATERFLEYPSVKKLMQSPRMVAILSDPEVNNAAIEKNYFVLFRNKHIIEAVNDAEFRKMVSEVDFNTALDHALKKPAADPGKSPTPKP